MSRLAFVLALISLPVLATADSYNFGHWVGATDPDVRQVGSVALQQAKDTIATCFDGKVDCNYTAFKDACGFAAPTTYDDIVIAYYISSNMGGMSLIPNATGHYFAFTNQCKTNPKLKDLFKKKIKSFHVTWDRDNAVAKLKAQKRSEDSQRPALIELDGKGVLDITYMSAGDINLEMNDFIKHQL